MKPQNNWEWFAIGIMILYVIVMIGGTIQILFNL